MGKPHLNTVYGNRVIGSNPVPRFAPPPPPPNQLLYSNRQETEWELSTNTNAGITVTIPNGFQYIVGLNHLRIMVDGVTIAPSEYTEIGYYADWSNKISFAVPLYKGQIIHVTAEFLGVPEYEEFLHNITSTLNTRVENYVSNYIDELKLLAASYFMAAETGWYTAADIDPGTVIDIPNNFHYVVGAHHLHVVVDGIVVEQDYYTEVGDYYTYSTQFKFNNTGIKQGQHIHLTASFLGTPEYEEFMQKLDSALKGIYDNVRAYAQGTVEEIERQYEELKQECDTFREDINGTHEELRRQYEEPKQECDTFREDIRQEYEELKQECDTFREDIRQKYEELKQEIGSGGDSEEDEEEDSGTDSEDEEEDSGTDSEDEEEDSGTGSDSESESVDGDTTKQKE